MVRLTVFRLPSSVLRLASFGDLATEATWSEARMAPQKMKGDMKKKRRHSSVFHGGGAHSEASMQKRKVYDTHSVGTCGRCGARAA